MKNILLFIDNLGAGGAQRQFVGLASLLQEKGYHVKVVTYYDQPFYLPILQQHNIPYECFHIHSYLSIFHLMKSILRFQADVLISYQTDPNILACICRWFIKIKLIVSERNTNTTTTTKDKITFWLYRWANYVVPNSYSQGEYIAKEFTCLRSKIRVISNFVDINHFSCTLTQRNIHTPLKILVVASVKPSKNTKLFIEALNKVIEKGYRLQVEWYGINSKENELPEYNRYVQECIDLVKKLQLTQYIRLLPKTFDIREKYMEADVFCLPSLFEGTPNVICEAMACQLPILCSDVCDNSRFVIKGVNGLLFIPTNVDDISETIIKFIQLSDVEKYKMGKESRRRAEQVCSMTDFIRKYVELIEK